jgi:hypothetical protein
MLNRRAFTVGAVSGAIALAIDGCSRRAWPQSTAVDVPAGFSRLHYEGFTNRSYDPLASIAEFRR